jgi:GTP cyclohydrolase I
MAEKYVVTPTTLNMLAGQCADRIASHPVKGLVKAYAVPRGGIPAALAIGVALAERYSVTLRLVNTPEDADIVVDDLIDTGSTSDRYIGKPFYALIDKRSWDHGDAWVIWPWEGDAVGGIEDNVRRLLQYVGEDPERGGLLETPHRVAKAWEFWCSGYDMDPADVLKTFEDGAEGTDEMIAVVDIPFYTHCEHHMAPFFGTATIAYIPDGKIVGLSKLSRVLQIYARRLQVQERLTCQVADALMEHLQPKGAAVVIKARHLCMESRGVCQQGHHTMTSALRGVFKDEPETRGEFLRLAGK